MNGISSTGYRMVYLPTHHRAQSNGCVPEHILIAEKALGRELPATVEVHHFNEIRHDNRNQNLIICEDRAYHDLLHRRQRVLNHGGDPNTDIICTSCKEVKHNSEFYVHRSGRNGKTHRCKSCVKLHGKRRYENLKTMAALYEQGFTAPEYANAWDQYKKKTCRSHRLASSVEVS